MEDLRNQLAKAIQLVKSQIRWNPGSAERHLLKRKLRGHLPAEATVEDYERIIQDVLADETAKVYVYRHNNIPYVAVTTTIDNQQWLVMFGLDGLMESAYVVERPDRYLNKPVFEIAGTIKEVLA